MAPEEESKPAAAQPDATGARPAPRRDRRPSRGRRGRGGRGRPKPARPEAVPLSQHEAASPGGEPEPIFAPATEPSEDLETVAPGDELRETPSEPAASAAVVQPSQPASPASVEKAIEEVNGVIDTLRAALDDMEELLEMLELFERQKNADEREIESLRRAVRQIHRPRDAGHQQYR